MGLKLNGATSGSVELDVPAAIGSDLNITIPGAAGTLDRLERAGNILQVVSTTKTDVYSETFATRGEGGDITGFTVTITPSSASSKILLTGFMSMGSDDVNNNLMSYRIYRDTTLISIGNSDGSTSRVTGSCNLDNGGNRLPGVATINFLDSPSTTSSVTYSIRFVQAYATNVVLYLNRGGDTLDSDTRHRATSTITAMEVAA
jgi:hypothetical protein